MGSTVLLAHSIFTILAAPEAITPPFYLFLTLLDSKITWPAYKYIYWSRYNSLDIHPPRWVIVVIIIVIYVFVAKKQIFNSILLNATFDMTLYVTPCHSKIICFVITRSLKYVRHINLDKKWLLYAYSRHTVTINYSTRYFAENVSAF